jgi:hypothetical protein
MRNHVRLLATGLTTIALGLGFISSANTAADEKANAPNAEVRKIADAFEKGDKAAAAAQAKALAEKTKELEEVMNLFKLRKMGGEGLGTKPDAVKPDGIEAKIQNMGKRVTPRELQLDGAALQRGAYIAAAIAEIAQHKCPVDKKTGDKDPKQWRAWSEEMRNSALDLAKAIKAADVMAVKKSATKLDGTCRNCHGVFRDDK